MRCPTCRPLLERYLVGALRPRQARALRAHLSHCTECAGLLEEARIVEALLSTSRAVELPADFTGAAMARVREMCVPRHARPAPWIFILLYLVAAWLAGIVWLTLASPNLRHIMAEMARSVTAFAAALASFAGNEHTLGHNAGVLLAFSLGVLLLDVAFLTALLIIYRFFRPRVAAHVSATVEVS